MRIIGQASSHGERGGAPSHGGPRKGGNPTPGYGNKETKKMGKNSDGDDVTLEDVIKTSRLYAINEQAFSPDADTRADSIGFLSGLLTVLTVASWATGSLATIGTIVGAVYYWPLAISVLTKLNLIFIGPIGLVVLGGVALAAVGGAIYELFDRPDWEDPTSKNSIARFSNNYPAIKLVDGELPDGIPANLKNQRPLEDLPGDMVDAASSFHGHGNTLDKVAVNLLYYELARKSTSIKPLVDKENPNNQIDFIINFLLLQEEEETIYPQYLVLESEVTPLNNKIFYSEEELNTEERRLKNKIVFSNRNFVNSRRSAISNIFETIDKLIKDAEKLTGKKEFSFFRNMRTNAREFRDNYMDEEANDAWYVSARTNMIVDVTAWAAGAVLATTNDAAENKVIQARNLIIGGGPSRSIGGYENELKEQYEVISAGLPYGRRLTDENYLTQLGKIERDIEQISASVEFAIGEESRVAQRRLEKNKIYGVKDVC